MYRQLGDDSSDISVLPINIPGATELYQPIPPTLEQIAASGVVVPYSAFVPSAPAQPVVQRPPAVAQAAPSGNYVSTAPPVQTASLSTQFESWLNTGSNKLILALGSVVFVVAAVAGKKRRR